MDRRSWPWRKRSSDRNSATVLADNENPVGPNQPTKLFNEQNFSKVLSSTERKPDEAVIRLQQAEEKLQVLTEKLSVALSENAAKENVVKQHTKVAEEAVCGWEKAEAEAASLKLELENTVQQKTVVEDQLSHVDEALKECMRQLRQAREDQEQKIHEVTIRNKREWDKLHAEFEAKLAEVDRRLVESQAENEVVTRTLHERGRTIAEITNAKTQVQTELSVFQIRLESAEKENASLKYEVQVLNKELDIRNKEREYSKRENEACNKQHLEDTKKIAKLEAECQKLRVFVRRKLPGPAALAQMKSEVGSLGSESGDTLRRRISSNHPGAYGALHLEAMQQRLQNGSREVEMLTERMQVMEEETRLLRESLAQRNSELHSARLMCARTASKLSTVGSQLEVLSHCSKLSGNRLSGVDAQLNGTRDLTSSKTASVLSISDGSIQDDEASSDAWASALISELAHLRKEKLSASPENLLDSEKLSLMDDFTEMEQLASSIISEDLTLSTESNKRHDSSKDQNTAKMTDAKPSDTSKVDEDENSNEVVAMETSGQTDSEIILNYQKLLQVLQTLAQKLCATSTDRLSQLLSDEDRSPIKKRDPDLATPPTSKTESLLLDDRLQKLSELSSKFLEGESYLTDLMKELYHFVDCLTNMFISSAVCQKTTDKFEVPSKDPNGPASISDSHSLDDTRQVDELSRSRVTAKAEIVLHESLMHSNLKAESTRLIGLEEQLFSLKAEKIELEHRLEEALQKIESITVQLVSADQLITELQDKLGSCQQSKLLVEEQLVARTALAGTLESRVKSSDAFIAEMKEKISHLEAELCEERENSHKTLTKLQELQQQLDSLGSCADKTLTEINSSEDFLSSAETVARSSKEKEITEAAERLVECQRSILVLGEQLRALTSPKQSPEASFRSKTDSASSAEKTTHSLVPSCYQIEESHRENDASGPSMFSGGLMSSPVHGRSMLTEYQVFDRHAQWSPPTQDISAYDRRRQLGSPFAETKLPIEVDPERKRTREAQLPVEVGYGEAEMLPPASPVDASHHSGGKSPTTFLTIKKKGSNSLSKTSGTVRSEKTSSSAFGRFFSRTKSQLI